MSCGEAAPRSVYLLVVSSSVSGSFVYPALSNPGTDVPPPRDLTSVPDAMDSFRLLSRVKLSDEETNLPRHQSLGHHTDRPLIRGESSTDCSEQYWQFFL